MHKRGALHPSGFNPVAFLSRRHTRGFRGASDVQVFMRRAPPPWAASAASRAATGDALTRPFLMEHARTTLEELLETGALQVHRAQVV